MGQARPSSHNLKYLVFFWMAASKGGHDDGIGGNIPVIKSLDVLSRLLPVLRKKAKNNICDASPTRWRTECMMLPRAIFWIAGGAAAVVAGSRTGLEPR